MTAPATPRRPRKASRWIVRVIGTVIGLALGWWAGSMLTSGPMPEPTTAPASH